MQNLFNLLTSILEKSSFQLNDSISNLSINDLGNWSESLFTKIIEQLSSILQPVAVDYSNQALSTQIYGLSIILFVMSLLMIALIIAFFINTIIVIYSDNLMNYFTNKYIRWYININKKIIGIELCFIGGTIIYGMYYIWSGSYIKLLHDTICFMPICTVFKALQSNLYTPKSQLCVFFGSYCSSVTLRPKIRLFWL